VAVRIRMKPMGRTHRAFYRIVAIDGRQPNDGRTLEDLGTYNPHDKNLETQMTLNVERVEYWKSVGAQTSHKVEILLQKAKAKVGAAPKAS
jgi:small subunit ribosomal protein S16